MPRFYNSLFLVISFFSQAQTIQSPAEFLGYELGNRFTRHHRVVDYFKYIDEVSPNVVTSQYGETYEHRPLIYTIVASTENFKKLGANSVGQPAQVGFGRRRAIHESRHRLDEL